MKSCMRGCLVCQVPNFSATGQPGNPATKTKAPRRNRRGAKSKNEFELAGYLAFFTLVASDPKSIQREANVGREQEFVKRGHNQFPKILFNRPHAPSTSRRLRSTSLAHLRNCSSVIAGGSSKLPRLKKTLRMMPT